MRMLDHDSVPASFEAAVAAVIGALDDADKALLAADTFGEAAVAVHGSMGRWMRNQWSLWESFGRAPEHATLLAFDVYRRFGLRHPDDITGLIIAAAFARVANVNLNLNQLADGYERHWAARGLKRDGKTKKAAT